MDEEMKKTLKQLGISDEGIAQIAESFDGFRKTVEEDAEKRLKDRLEKAKQVCLEEVESEKQRLVRLVEIYLESRSNTITKEAQKQAAIGESESSKTLREMKALLEGVELENVPEEYQAAVAECKKLRVKLFEAEEHKKQLADKANRATGIAMRALKHAKMLETRNAPKSPVAEGKKPVQLETLRESTETPKTARPVAESQVPARQDAKPQPTSVDAEVMAIAGQLDGSPAFVQGR